MYHRRAGENVLIALVAGAAMLPAFWHPDFFTDSQIYNTQWIAGHFHALSTGQAYPRWIDNGWDGFGSAIFYFYPQLYYWLTSLLLAVGIPSGPMAAAIVQALLLIASAMAMRAWLSTNARPTVALAGALAYLLAPFHLNEFYLRGALAESLAYLFMPLIALSLSRLAARQDHAMLWLALAYAGLVSSHLPLGLLVSLFLIAPMLLWQAMQDPGQAVGFLVRAVAALATGLLLSAPYLVPALMLLPQTASKAVWIGMFQPDQWFFWTPQRWPNPARMPFIIALTMGLATIAVSALWGRTTSNRGGGLWVAVAGACLLMISGAVPILWQLTLLEKVQFPWRLLPVLEFAAISALAFSRARSVPVLAGGAALTGLALVLMVMEAWPNLAFPVHRRGHDAVEYLPAGYPLASTPGAPFSPEKVQRPPLVTPQAVGGLAVWQQADDQGQGLAVSVPATTMVVVPRFFFPGWHIVNAANGQAVAAQACTRWRLVCWPVPVGHSQWRLARTMVAEERMGWWGGALGAVMLLLIAGRRRFSMGGPSGQTLAAG